VADQVASGVLTPEEARRHPFRNVITQALGNGGELDIAIQELRVKNLDRILLCSDGLSGMVQDREIWDIVRKAPDMDAAAGALVAKAMESGGEDNITVVLAAFDQV
jgi:protein phosphatase